LINAAYYIKYVIYVPYIQSIHYFFIGIIKKLRERESTEVTRIKRLLKLKLSAHNNTHVFVTRCVSCTRLTKLWASSPDSKLYFASAAAAPPRKSCKSSEGAKETK
jgi:hypothetical protein